MAHALAGERGGGLARRGLADDEDDCGGAIPTPHKQTRSQGGT